MARFHFPLFLALCLPTLLAGCGHDYGSTPYPDPPVVGPYTYTHMRLQQLPPPGPPVTVAVYGFPDMTGQNKFTPGISYAELSKAVTQGGGTLLIDILRSAGNGRWFDVVERPQVDDLLRERKLIDDAYTKVSAPEGARAGHKGANPSDKKEKIDDGRSTVLPPLRFADYLFAGGITGYDRGYMTGGIGASYLGLGGSVGYQKDVVNVTLRLIDVLSGDVVASVNTSKTVYSFQVTPEIRRYVSVSDLLSVDGGLTTAEPTLLAVREAMELALYQMLLSCYYYPTWCVPRTNSPSRLHQPNPLAYAAPAQAGGLEPIH